MIDRIGLNTSD